MAIGRPDLTEAQQNTVAQFLIQRSSNGKLKYGAKKEAAEFFGYNLSTIWRIWNKAAAQQQEGIPVHVKSKKMGSVHKDKKQLDEQKVKNLSVLQRSSLRIMAGNLGVSKSLVHQWVKQKKLKPHTNAVKPFLTEQNKLCRLSWSLSQLGSIVESGKIKFQTMYNTIHVDEKWFYLTKTKGRYYLLPSETEPYRTCKSKRFIPKIMFNCAVSRPIIDKDDKIIFDGKFGIFPFIEEQPALRNSKNRIKGTMEIHPIPAITKEVHKNNLINQMIPVIKAKWPDCLSKHIFIQQDNAKPHIQDSDPDFQAAANSDGFHIQLICQPANSPDTNVNDLGFFRAIQTLKDQKPANGVKDLLANVKEAFEEYSPIKLNNVFLTLQGCYEKIMKVRGDNTYKILHMGKERLLRLGQLPECLEVDEQLVRDSFEFLNMHGSQEERFCNMDSLLGQLNQVGLED